MQRDNHLGTKERKHSEVLNGTEEGNPHRIRLQKHRTMIAYFVCILVKSIQILFGTYQERVMKHLFV